MRLRIGAPPHDDVSAPALSQLQMTQKGNSVAVDVSDEQWDKCVNVQPAALLDGVCWTKSIALSSAGSVYEG